MFWMAVTPFLINRMKFVSTETCMPVDEEGVTAIQHSVLKWCREFGVDPMWNICRLSGRKPEHYDDYPRILRLLFHLKPPSGLFP